MRTSLLLTGLLLGCVSTDYVGKTYTSTQNVDVYFHMEEVDKPHEVMGRIRSEATEYMSFERIEQDLIKQAMKRGADAAVIEGMDTIEVGSTTTSSGHDSGDPHYYDTKDGKLGKRGGHEKWSSSSYTTEVRDHVLTGELLKYK